MKIQTTNSVLRIFLSSIKNIVSVCYSAITETLSTVINIPLSARYKLTSAQKCTIHINRILQIFDGILDAESLKFNSFDPMQFLERLSQSFTDTVLGYANIHMNVYSGLKFDYPLMTNKDLLELTLLNLLYAGLRNADTERNKKLKFALYLTSNRHNIIIHLRDNCVPISPEIIDAVFSGSSVELNKDHAFDSAITFSLIMAKLSATELKGKFEYRALKSGNRFDIILPKLPKAVVNNVAMSPKIYTPTLYYFKTVFADLFEDDIPQEFLQSQE